MFRNRQRELFPLKRQRGLFPLVQGEHPEWRHTAVCDKGSKRLRQASTILEILSATRLADRRVALVRPVTPVPAAILDEGV